MKTLKTLAAGVTAAILAMLGGVVVAPSVALAAEFAAPSGTVADWSYTAPWAAGSGNGSDCVASDGSHSTRGLWDVETSSCSLPVTGSKPALGPADIDAYLGLGQARTTGGWTGDIGVATGGGTAFAAVNFRMSSAQPSFTLDLASRFPDLTGRFYAEAGDRRSGTAVTDVYGNPLRTLRGFPFTITAVPGGVRVDTQMGAPSNPWESHVFTVVAERTDGTRMRINVAVGSLDYGGRPTANGIAYTVPVGKTLHITKADLAAAATFRSGVETDVVIDVATLTEAMTATADGVDFLSAVPTTDGFDFRAEEIQAPMTSRIASDAARVTITAVDAPAPVVAPTVDDFAFPAPLPGGVEAEVDLLALTHGESFDPREWTVEASDAVQWDVRGGTLLLTPEADGVALSTTWRWRSLIDSSVTSRWATVTAPAATPVTPEPEPTPDPEPTVTPGPTVTPTPSATPDAVSPTPPPGGAETGDEGLTLLGYGLAVLLGTAVSVITRSRRFARR